MNYFLVNLSKFKEETNDKSVKFFESLKYIVTILVIYL